MRRWIVTCASAVKKLKRCGAWIGPWLLLLGTASAHAHGDIESAQAPFAQWPLSADVIIGLIVAAVLYARGLRQLRDKSVAAHRVRHWTFYGGLASIFLALQTPLDVISEHVFAVHQLQHLLLRGIAPMLLMVATPAGPLIAGMPVALRRTLLAPIMGNGVVRAIFRFLARPLVCTVLYVGTLYVWQVPAYHDAALLDNALHYLMHVTMLLSGMLFFWCVFDPRPAPWGVPFSHRLVMLGAAIFANIPLGAVITLKTTVVYAAYDRAGRWWGITPLTDELLGGLIIWIPASMMGLIAVLLLVRLWGQSDTRLDDRRLRGFTIPPGNPAAANAMNGTDPSRARRRLGWGLACVPLAVFAGVIVMAVMLTRRPELSPDRGTFLLPATARTDRVPKAQAKAALPIARAGRDHG